MIVKHITSLLVIVLSLTCTPLSAQLETYYKSQYIPNLNICFFYNAKKDQSFTKGIRYTYEHKVNGGLVLDATLIIDTTMKCAGRASFERDMENFKKQFYDVKDTIRDYDGWGVLEINSRGKRDAARVLSYMKIISTADFGVFCSIVMRPNQVKEAEVLQVLNSMSVSPGNKKFPKQNLNLWLPGGFTTFEMKERPKALGLVNCYDNSGNQLVTVEALDVAPKEDVIKATLDTYWADLSKKPDTRRDALQNLSELKKEYPWMGGLSDLTTRMRYTEKLKDGSELHVSDYFLVNYNKLSVLRIRFELRGSSTRLDGTTVTAKEYEQHMMDNVLYDVKLLKEPMKPADMQEKPKNILYDTMGFSIKTPARITDPGKLYSTPEYVFKSLGECVTAAREKEVLRLFSYNRWPKATGENFGDESGGNWQLLSTYVVCELEDKYILYVPHRENQHLPKEARPNFDFYIVIDKEGVRFVTDKDD